MYYLTSYRRFLTAVCIIAFCAIANIYAQPDPCVPDCDNNWTDYRDTIELANCQIGCYAIIDYSIRIACGMYQDIEITQIETRGNCGSCTAEFLYQQSLFAIITNNSMGFNPQNGTTGCSSIWRASIGACVANWKVLRYVGTHIDTVTIVHKCDEEACCLQSLRVCRYRRIGLPDSVVITSTGTAYSNNNCSTAEVHEDIFPAPPAGTKCMPACDWLNDLFFSGTGLGKGSTNTQYWQDYGTYSAVRPNPTSDFAEIKIDSPAQGTITIQLTDAAGNIVMSINRTISIGENLLSFDISSLSSGKYFYNLLFLGNRLHSGSLTVLR